MHPFDTPDPVSLRVRLGTGSVTVTAADAQTSTVDLVPHGAGAEALVDAATVTCHGGDLLVDVPRRRGRGDLEIEVVATVPSGSSVTVDTDSADVSTTGTVDVVRIATGSGDVDVAEATGAVQVSTGSGDVRVGRTEGPTRIGTGSGDVEVGVVLADLSLKTGSGDLRVREARGAVELRSGSGDLTVDDARGDVVLKSGSGDLTVGRVGATRVQATNASGDVEVRVAGDLPAWLDLSTVTGRISSDLDPGEPADGEPYAEVHATSVSGDVVVGRA
ncbi:MAG: DUF4097 family beta strand repeat-containing protein [Nocardioidaceae bacterium]|nr:DUF4097 family beta strand repeat-containing protein [Nocardioidaceae bacterium]